MWHFNRYSDKPHKFPSRPYPMITKGPNKMSSHVCNSDKWNRLAFGYKFNTDMLLLRTVLDPLLINSRDLHPTESPLRDAALSAKEAILAAIIGGVCLTLI